jgi:hypothetical protein
MSIFDDIPLPIGTKWNHYEIVGWDSENQKYEILETRMHKGDETYWRSRQNIETRYAETLLKGVESRESKPGNSYNTRFFRSKT